MASDLIAKLAGVCREGQDRVKLAYSLAQRLMFFVQEYLRYITFDILEPMWRSMEDGIRKAHNVDEVRANVTMQM